MRIKKARPGKWIALFTVFMGAMCSICLCFGVIAGNSGLLETETVQQPTAIAARQVPTQIVEVNPTAAPPKATAMARAAETAIPTETVVVLPVAAAAQGDANPLRVTFVNVGQGDSTLIQTPEGFVILIDGGEKDTGIVSYLRTVGIKRIDLMIATHPHSDHIGGLVQVLGTFPVAKVVTNGQAHTTVTYENFLDGIATAKAEYVEVKRGDQIKAGSLVFSVLSPVANTYTDMNENSLILRFTFEGTTFLMMGDAGKDSEASLLASGQNIRADIFKVGHHGSTTGSSPAFLNQAKPTIAVYNAGIGNQYHHPAPSTIAALSAVGATIYGTDQNGNISIRVDQNSYLVVAENSQSIVSVVPPVILPEVQPTTTPERITISTLEIVSVTSQVPKGANATLTAKASPGSACGITVYYKSGPSTAVGLGPKTADANGSVSWTWKVGSRTTSGSWRIVVTCGGISKETSFMVY